MLDDSGVLSHSVWSANFYVVELTYLAMALLKGILNALKMISNCLKSILLILIRPYIDSNQVYIDANSILKLI